MSHVRPWQVCLVDFGQPLGSEPAGIRPAVVVASELHCRFPLKMTIVVPLTTRARGLPHHIPVSQEASGLGQPSWARTEDVTTVSTDRITSEQPLGQLTDSEAEAVRYWLRRMISV